MFVFHGRDGLRAVRLIISGPYNKEKIGRPRMTTEISEDSRQG
jgi:hypothetical protein